MTQPVNKLPYGRQVALLMDQLGGMRSNRTDKRFEPLVQWVRDLPGHARPPELLTTLSRAFSVPEGEIKRLIDHKEDTVDFESLLPRTGWLADYIQYTRYTEPPTVFHFFVGCAVLGGLLRRNVHYDKGYAKLFPNLSVILVAPSGKCRKTSCCELGIGLLRKTSIVTILADKITPEALTNAYAEKGGDATLMFFAGELKQFLGDQKYMQGMIPLLTRLLDSPDEWSSETIGKGKLTLTNVCFSMLGASTMDWLKQLPSDSFGGGFMSRFLLVVQESTPRSFPLPPPMSATLRGSLMKRLIELQHLRSKFSLTANAEDWYRTWYDSKSLGSEDKLFSGYFERKPDNLFRLAMLLAVAEDNAAVLEVRHLRSALSILDWTEAQLPQAFGQLGSNAQGEEVSRMVGQLKRNGGSMKHSDWLRRNSSRMNARQFKEGVDTLRQAKLVDFDGIAGVYFLTPDGWRL